MWYIKLHVMEAVQSTLAKPANMLPLEFGASTDGFPKGTTPR